MLSSDLICEAWRRAGLSQAELGARVGTAQAGIARWKSGRNASSFENVRRLVRACGFDLEVALVPYDDSDMAQAERLLALLPTERIVCHERLTAQMRELRSRGA